MTRRRVLQSLFVGALVCWAVGSLAQTTPTAAGSMTGQEITWKQIIEYGGWILYLIGIVSVFALANVLVLLFSLRTSAVVPRSLVRDVVARVREGDLAGARILCEDRPCAFAKVASTVIDYVTDSPEADAAMVKDMLVGEGVRQATRLQGSTQWLVDVSAVAPMLGLLGTVVGMLVAFSAVGGEIAAAKPVMLAQGVGRALITTIAGLMVAIPAHLCYAWFRRGASRLTAQLETAAHELLTAIFIQRES